MVNRVFVMGLRVDFFHTCTFHVWLHACALYVWTFSTHAPSMCGLPPHTPFFVCRSTTDVGMKFGRFGLHVEGMLTEFRTNLVCICV